MATKKRSKKYDAGRWLRQTVNGIERRMDTKPLEPKRQDELALGHHLAFEQLLTAQSDDGWYEVAGHLRMALALARSDVGSEYEGEIKAAMACMVRARRSFDAGDGLVIDDAAKATIALAIEIHDAQLVLATRDELKTAANAIIAEIAVKADSYEYLEAA